MERAQWSPVFKDRASAVSWDGHEAKAQQAYADVRRRGADVRRDATEWWALVEAGKCAEGVGAASSSLTDDIADYRGCSSADSKRASSMTGTIRSC